MFAWWHRRRARAEPFPEAWREILRANVPFYEELTDPERARFEEKLKVFVRTKHFIPAGGMEIDDTVKVVIAAGAARLSMNLPDEWFARLTEVVVYNNAWHARGHHTFGEAHAWGTVVLSYQNVLGGLKNPDDGRDVSLHEFAHVLDRADGSFDGTPELAARTAYSPWVDAMSRHYLRLRKAKRKQLLDSYGATNEAEFFAVATELFFEKPARTKERYPDLYAVLADYYRTDPAG